MSDFVYLRGTGGGVFEYTPPLHREIRKQYDARQLVRVNADGSDYDGPDDLADDDEDPAEDEDGDPEEPPEGDGSAGPEASASKRGRGSKAAAEGA